MTTEAQLIYSTLADKHDTITLTKKQTAHELRIGTTKLDQLRASGDIKFVTVGSQIRFRLLDIAEFLTA